MKMKKRKGFAGILIFIAVFAAGSAVVMLLWNWLIPAIIGWEVIGFWQAAGILLLCRILFGGFSGRGNKFAGGMHGMHHMHHHGPQGYFTPQERAEMRDRVKNMDPDERREYIRRHMYDCYGKPEQGKKPGDADQ